MKRKKDDIFETWKKNNIISVKLDFIKKASQSFFTQKRMCERLGISEATFIKLKKNHPEIQEAINEGEEALLHDLFNATLLKAKGQTVVLHHRSAEKGPMGGQKQKLMEEEKYYPPDLESIKYILMTKFGREYNPRKDVIDIMEKKSEPEVWADEPDDIMEIREINHLKTKKKIKAMRAALEVDDE